ncbi:MAG: 23S rRNA (adenine(2503)-C(2))-methyltransferase RlmN [Candidatus Omnitrophica bacterium]|nr:23S rRNA (adenine(2503)-C(2))-methyltransferase RlmN [Candidatus Omnitrophota bacterium]
MHSRNINSLTLQELQELLASWKTERFHARQIFSWIYQKGIRDFTRMTNLPLDLRRKLNEGLYPGDLKLLKALESIDGTKKILFKLKDSNLIEGVVIPARGRITGCVSTQVGCKFCCSFCASGILGFKRNLDTAEMLDEIWHLKNNAPLKKLTHIVFMGTGEPLDNYENVLKTIRFINSSLTYNIGARRITISTCGVLPGIQRLAKEGLQIELSVSLHAADEGVRNFLMPINKIYPLRVLIPACRQYIKETNRQITFEYILIKGVNSDLQNAKNLSRILKGLNCKVNLIPANSIKELNIQPPKQQEVSLFQGVLLKSGIKATLRKPRGEDIEASCGQLRLRYEKK